MTTRSHGPSARGSYSMMLAARKSTAPGPAPAARARAMAVGEMSSATTSSARRARQRAKAFEPEDGPIGADPIRLFPQRAETEMKPDRIQCPLKVLRLALRPARLLILKFTVARDILRPIIGEHCQVQFADGNCGASPV